MTDEAWWHAHCLESLELQPWQEDEIGHDGRGYVVMRPNIPRRRKQYEKERTG